jgi:hypothetical protein
MPARLSQALARLHLAAQGHGSRVPLRNASPQLLGLVAFMGLTDVLRNERVHDR